MNYEIARAAADRQVSDADRTVTRQRDRVERLRRQRRDTAGAERALAALQGTLAIFERNRLELIEEER